MERGGLICGALSLHVHGGKEIHVPCALCRHVEILVAEKCSGEIHELYFPSGMRHRGTKEWIPECICT